MESDEALNNRSTESHRCNLGSWERAMNNVTAWLFGGRRNADESTSAVMPNISHAYYEVSAGAPRIFAEEITLSRQEIFDAMKAVDKANPSDK